MTGAVAAWREVATSKMTGNPSRMFLMKVLNTAIPKRIMFAVEKQTRPEAGC
jgi:hypothetical protein